MLIQHDKRELTADERDYVAPRVKRIEQLRLVLAGTSHGGAWTNRRTQELHAEERDLRKYLFSDRNLYFVTWRDERGLKRQLEIEPNRHHYGNKFVLTIR